MSTQEDIPKWSLLEHTKRNMTEQLACTFSPLGLLLHNRGRHGKLKHKLVIPYGSVRVCQEEEQIEEKNVSSFSHPTRLMMAIMSYLLVKIV